MFKELKATIAFVSGIISSKLTNHKRIHASNDIIEDVKVAFGVDVNYMKAWQAKEHAIKIVRGRPTIEYRQLSRYIYMLNSVYPNSYIRMHKSTNNEFMY